MFWFDVHWQLQHVLHLAWWPLQLLLLAIIVVLGFLAYRSPAHAAGAVLVLLPTYLIRAKIWFVPVTFLELCILVVFGGWLLRMLQQRQAIRGYRYPFRNLILLILLAATVGMFISSQRIAAAGLWKAYFIEPILFFILLINIVRRPENRPTMLWALGLSSLSVSLLAIFQKYTGFAIPEGSWVAPATRRVTAMFTSPNAVGLYLAPIITIYAGWFLQSARRIISLRQIFAQTARLSIFALAVLATVFTVSHGTFLGLIAAAVFISFFGISKRWTTIIAFALLMALLLIPITGPKIIALITFSDAAGQNRLVLWQGAWDYLNSGIKTFLFGAGLFGFPLLQEQFRDPLALEPLLYPHNIILNFWMEIGLLGVISFAILVIKFFRMNISELHVHPDEKWLRLGVMAAMVALLAHGLLDVPYFKNDLAILFWTIVALAV